MQSIEFLPYLPKEYLNSSHCWVGYTAKERINGLVCDSIDLYHCPYFRAPSYMHGKYDVVWMTEYDFSNETNWKIILDEAVRLVRANGVLIVSYPFDFLSHKSNVMSIKAFLGRKLGITAELIWENPLVHPKSRFVGVNKLTSMIRIKRHDTESYQSNRWTFAMITRGGKSDVVSKFCESVREQVRGDQHEILVLGPEDESLRKYNIRFIEDSGFNDDYAEISKKKNLIVQEASFENIAIAHDRYFLKSNFVSGFDFFGYDFDIVCIPQFYSDQITDLVSAESGDTLNSLFLKGHRTFNFTQSPSEGFNIQDLYVGGGFMVFKKKSIESIGFNPLILWSQAEDVELSKYFSDFSCPVRLNSFSEAVSTLESPYGNHSVIKKHKGYDFQSLQAKMMQDPKISIVLPTFNGSRFIRESIDSVLRQNYQNWELIIIDDCSSDETPKIVEHYASRDSRIKVFRNQVNLKLPGSLNEGFKRATGDLYTWTSDDNVFRQNALSAMVRFLYENPTKAMVYCDHSRINDAGKVIGKVALMPPEFLAYGCGAGACFLYYAEAAKIVGEYDKNYFLIEDLEYWLRFFNHFEMGHLKKDLYLYRIHDSNLGTVMRPQARAIFSKLVGEYLPRMDIPDKVKARIFVQRYGLRPWHIVNITFLFKAFLLSPVAFAEEIIRLGSNKSGISIRKVMKGLVLLVPPIFLFLVGYLAKKGRSKIDLFIPNKMRPFAKLVYTQLQRYQ